MSSVEMMLRQKIDRLSTELVAARAAEIAALEAENRMRGNREYWMNLAQVRAVELERLEEERDKAALDANLALSLLDYHGYTVER